MGYIKHHTIVVTDWIGYLDPHHEKALSLFEGKLVSPIIDGTNNGQQSFFIAPDGSKEGWSDSDRYDNIRLDFVQYLEKNNVEYVHFYWGGDDDKKGFL